MDISTKGHRKRKVFSSSNEEKDFPPNKQQKVASNKGLSTYQKKTLKKLNQKERKQLSRAKMTEIQKSTDRNKNKQQKQQSRTNKTSIQKKA